MLSLAVVNQLLRFLYTDQVDNMQQYALDLLAVSGSQYMIDLLKYQCQVELCNAQSRQLYRNSGIS